MRYTSPSLGSSGAPMNHLRLKLRSITPHKGSRHPRRLTDHVNNSVWWVSGCMAYSMRGIPRSHASRFAICVVPPRARRVPGRGRSLSYVATASSKAEGSLPSQGVPHDTLRARKKHGGGLTHFSSVRRSSVRLSSVLLGTSPMNGV